jgi:hypothetical protein
MKENYLPHLAGRHALPAMYSHRECDSGPAIRVKHCSLAPTR